MSLINQVLKDLDRQRGPADGSHVAALQGVGLVPGRALSVWPRIGTVFTLLVALILLGISAFEYLNRPTTVTQQAVRPSTASDVSGRFPVSEEQVSIQAAPAPDAESMATPAAEIPVQTKDPVVPVETTSIRSKSTRDSGKSSLAAETETPPEVAPTPVSVPVKRMSPGQRAEQNFLKARRAIDREDVELAEKLLTASLDENARHVDARVQLASLLINKDRGREAELLLIEGIEYTPGEMAPRRLYAQLLASRGDFKAALATLETANTGTDQDAETLGLRAAIHARLDDFELSASDYRHALTLDPRRAEWWTGLGIALEHLGRADVAVTAYQRALDLPLQESLRTFSEQRLLLLQQPHMEKDG